MEREEVAGLAAIMGCKVGLLSASYHGLPFMSLEFSRGEGGVKISGMESQRGGELPLFRWF